MAVAVVGIREVRMRVGQGFMPMPVAVLGAGLDRGVVGVMMMFVVYMLVLVFQRLMRVFVPMPFGKMQPNSERHQRPGA